MAVHYVDMKGFDLQNTTSSQLVDVFQEMSSVYNSKSELVLTNVVDDGVKLSPIKAYLRGYVSGGGHYYFQVYFDLYWLRVADTGRVQVIDMTPQPTPTITASTDELFVQTYLDGLADGATVVVTPKARTQGQMYSLNLGTKVIYLDFSGYTGTVSITCTGFTSQGNKVYKVTGAISPWIQSESAKAITINED